VRNGDGGDVHPAELHRLTVLEWPRLSFRLRCPGKGANGVVENVRKPSRETIERFASPVDGKRSTAAHGDGAQIVDPVRVVGVIVGVKHRIDPVHVGRDELHAQLRRRIDEEPRPIVRLDERAYARAPVARIGRAAHLAVTPELRHPKAGAGAEKGELHTTSTFIRFVLPG
jgi:hypothetical protein